MCTSLYNLSYGYNLYIILNTATTEQLFTFYGESVILITYNTVEISTSVLSFIKFEWASNDYTPKNCMYYKYLPQTANSEP